MPSTASLGEDLAALVSAVGVPLAAATELSHRGVDRVAPAFRLTFADGTTLKGTRLETADTAALVATLAPDLGDIVARIVAHTGSALLSEWVEGDTLATVACSDALLRRCGAAQGAVHARTIPAGDPRNEAIHWRRNVRRRVDALQEAGLLSGDETAALAALALRHAPDTCAVGVCLVDYCPENIVLRRGEPCLIDIETVSIAPCDYDLARTWYRWPMTGEQRDAYLAGYRDHRDASAFLLHAPFWHIAALANGALFRHRRRSGAPALPLAALRALLRDAEGGAP